MVFKSYKDTENLSLKISSFLFVTNPEYTKTVVNFNNYCIFKVRYLLLGSLILKASS